MANEGMSKLARVLNGRIQNNREAYGDLVLDFGQIQSDYSLLTNTYPIPIPKADYLVCRQLTLGGTGSQLTATGTKGTHEHTGGTHEGHTSGDGSHTHDGGGHSHTVTIPEKMRWLNPGDRVLVAWVQNDAIVVDIICSATEIG